ncbi:MAG: hypothetical protein JOY69_06425 [Candidatus Eremiobacteraeota bacterium]|nr:hypothetical protein [Candidatus Eremiobacteraeota bacterium]
MHRTSSQLLWVSIALASAAGIAACSGGAQRALPGTTAYQNVGTLSPFAESTPPVTAPVKIPYPYTNTWVTKTWSGPSAKPSSQPGSDDGLITVKFKIDKKTGIYDVPESIDSKTGYNELLNSAIGFLPYKGGIAQIILSDNFSYVAGPLTQTGTDTYPNGQNSIDFPLTKGRRWSAAAAHISYFNVALSGKGAFVQNVSTNEQADGNYTNQTSFSHTKGQQNQDNYASTSSVFLNKTSVYKISERAAGFNLLKQTFSTPLEGSIVVRSSGKKPLPVKPGTVDVPNWYPSDVHTLYADNWQVAGAAKMPKDCGKRTGESSTEVVEKSHTLDPVQGFYNTYTAYYYLTSLATGQYWFACIVQDYTNTTYANGWIFSAGDWGGQTPASQQVGKEILIASGAKPDVKDLRKLPKLRIFAFVAPAALTARVASLGLHGNPAP